MKTSLTVFENCFATIKTLLEDANLYCIWPDFEQQYDEHEYAPTTLQGLDEVLPLNCGFCDVLSDLRHGNRRKCADSRNKIAEEADRKPASQQKDKWARVLLCRIHTEQSNPI